MSLDRNQSSIRLQSTDGNYYSVPLVDNGGSVIVPDPDETSATTSSGDPYAGMIGADGKVYRWSLETISAGNVQHLLILSTNQSEPAMVGVDILLGSTWYRVAVDVLTAENGTSIPNLAVGPGQPWVPILGLNGVFDVFLDPDLYDIAV